MVESKYVNPRPEEAVGSGVLDTKRIKSDTARVEPDMARANADAARSELEVESSELGMPADVLARVREEADAAAAVVAELEADANAKGIPLSLAGTRYAIYYTAPD